VRWQWPGFAGRTAGERRIVIATASRQDENYAWWVETITVLRERVIPHDLSECNSKPHYRGYCRRTGADYNARFARTMELTIGGLRFISHLLLLFE